ncbi:MAG: SgcJ/EcaC family oxidoreductase [Geminicoccaceae bacterium]
MTAVASPHNLPSLFAGAWNSHDMAALARLFAEDADFVNVVGIWWRNRRAIEEAHAFAHRSFFRDSRLHIDDVAVKRLRPDLATVHSAWTLSGQTEPDGSVGEPRRGVLLLVASQEHDGWLIRTAQNTDIVPEALTAPANKGLPESH